MALHASRDQSLRGVVRDPRILGGEPTVEGTRVPVRSIVQVYGLEPSVEAVCAAFPMLDRFSIERALAFYQGHRDEIDRHIAENQDDDAS